MVGARHLQRLDRGGLFAGPRFAYLKGDLVFLELALVRWVLEVLRGLGYEKKDRAPFAAEPHMHRELDA